MATPKAMEILEAERKRRNSTDVNDPDFFREITTPEAAKLVWRCYIPTIGMATVTAACMIGATKIGNRRNAALIGMYTFSEKALADYQRQVVKQVGEKKENEIREGVAQERLLEAKVQPSVLTLQSGKSMCFDSLSGRFFESDIETLRQIANDFNYKLISEMSMSLNELYYMMGLPRNELGDDMGWRIEYGTLEFAFSAKIADDTKRPYIVVDYRTRPVFLEYN